MDKTVVDFKNTVDVAIDRYVKDKKHTDPSPKAVVDLTALKRLSPVERLLPQLLTSTPITSSRMAEFVREAKLRVNIIASHSQILQNEIGSAASDFWSTLDDVQNELKVLDSDIQEEEIKAEDKFQQVHYNAFNRSIDMFAKENKVRQLDFKTGVPFLTDQTLHVIPGVGLTLPRLKQESVFIRNIVLLAEGTDVGDTPTPLISTSPNNLLDPDLSFRHVIARKAYDDTGKLYNYTESTCQLLVELGHIQLVNHINLRPASQSPIFVKALEYINEAGERTSIDIESLSLDGNLSILFEPVRTNNLIITLVQYASIEETEVYTGDIRKSQINRVLDGAGWSINLPLEGEYLKARIYDFSLESLAVELLSYKQSGFFLSQKIPVQKPLSFSLAVDTETIQISNTQRAYGSDYFLPTGTVLYETYAKIELINDLQQLQTQITIPVPSTKKAQTELMPIVGGQARMSFVPDLFFTSMQYKVKTGTYIGPYAFMEFTSPHGIPTGVIYTDKLEVYAGRELPALSFISEQWEAISDTVIACYRTDGSVALTVASENFTPQIWAVRHLGAEPFSVYEEEVKLTLGSDYQYSIDNGVTWYSELLTLAQLAELEDTLHAGSFRIKLLAPDYDKYYWCDYKRANTQYLDPSKLFLLKKNSVIVDPKLRNLNGSLQTVVVLRADSRIPYLSSIVHNYKLKVRQL